MISSVPQDQADAFGLLRRPQVATDLLPEDRWATYHRGSLGRLGLNPALARRAVTPLGNVWVVPGDGWMCLSMAASQNVSSFDGGGLTANTTEQAFSNGLISWTGSRAGNGQLVQGLVSDRVADVTLIASDGTVTKPTISDNVFGADLNSALASVLIDGRIFLSLRVPDGPHV